MGCFRFAIPSYDELSLFLMSVAFVVLDGVDPTLRAESHARLFAGLPLLPLIGVAFCAIGMVLAIYHVFAARRKTEPEKWVLLFFAIIVNYASAVAAGIHVFRELQGWLVVFPLWNAINGVALVLMAGFGRIDETSIRDENATAGEVFAGLLLLGMLLVICHHFLELYWAITLSICVGWATTFDGMARGLTGLVGGGKARGG